MSAEYRDALVPDLVIIGAASRDIDTADPRGWRLGGGVTYASRTAAGLGLSVAAVIGLDEEASSAHELDELGALGVALRPVPLAAGPVFENRETERGREQMVHSASEQMDPTALPARWRRARGFLLDPVAGELPETWADVLPADGLVALDLQGLVRELRPGELVRPRPLASGPLVLRADMTTISEEDARGGGLVLADLVARDGQELVVKHGERGGLHVRRHHGRIKLRTIPIVPDRVRVDRTGAGDAFICGWMVGRLLCPEADPWDMRALHLASLLAALTVERTPIDRRAIRQRLAELAQPLP